MKDESKLIKIIDIILEKTNNISDEDRQSLIDLRQQFFNGTKLDNNDLEKIQAKIKDIAVNYYHDLDDLEKLIPPIQPNHPRTAE